MAAPKIVHTWPNMRFEWDESDHGFIRISELVNMDNNQPMFQIITRIRIRRPEPLTYMATIKEFDIDQSEIQERSVESPDQKEFITLIEKELNEHFYLPAPTQKVLMQLVAG